MAGVLHHDHGDHSTHCKSHKQPLYPHDIESSPLSMNGTSQFTSPTVEDVLLDSRHLPSADRFSHGQSRGDISEHRHLVVDMCSSFQTNREHLSQNCTTVPHPEPTSCRSKPHSHFGASAFFDFIRGGGHTDSNVNINVRSAFLHVIGDLIQSVGVVLASVTIYMRPDWVLVDPLCTFLFSIIVIWTTFRLLQEAIHALMEGTPYSINTALVRTDFLSVDGVTEVHDLHVWSISSTKYALTAHLITKCVDAENSPKILSLVKRILSEKYRIEHSTIELSQSNR